MRLPFYNTGTRGHLLESTFSFCRHVLLHPEQSASNVPLKTPNHSAWDRKVTADIEVRYVILRPLYDVKKLEQVRE